MLQYPMFKNYYDTAAGENGSVLLADPQGQVIEIPARMYAFAVKLDGRRSPYSIPGYSVQERRIILRELRRAKLVRQSRVLESHFGSIYLTLVYGNLNARFDGVAKVWNCLLAFTFLPVLAAGALCYIFSSPSFEGSIWGGCLLGTALGIVLHEFSHGAACIAYGGRVFEAGVMIHAFMPGAYVLMDHDAVKGKMKRIQINAAGVETNLFFGGLCFLAASFMPFDGFFCGMGAVNVVLCLLNLCFFGGMDGSRILGELLGSGVFEFRIRDVLFRDTVRGKLVQKPYGIAVIAAAGILFVGKIALPILILDNLLYLIEVLK